MVDTELTQLHNTLAAVAKRLRELAETVSQLRCSLASMIQARGAIESLFKGLSADDPN